MNVLTSLKRLSLTLCCVLLSVLAANADLVPSPVTPKTFETLDFSSAAGYITWGYEGDEVKSYTAGKTFTATDANGNEIATSTNYRRSGTNVYVYFTPSTLENAKSTCGGKIIINVPAGAITLKNAGSCPAHQIIFSEPVVVAGEAKTTTWVYEGKNECENGTATLASIPENPNSSTTLHYYPIDKNTVTVADGTYVEVYKGTKDSGTYVGEYAVSSDNGGIAFNVSQTITEQGEYHFYIADEKLGIANSNDYYTDVHFVITVAEPEAPAQKVTATWTCNGKEVPEVAKFDSVVFTTQDYKLNVTEGTLASVYKDNYENEITSKATCTLDGDNGVKITVPDAITEPGNYFIYIGTGITVADSKDYFQNLEFQVNVVYQPQALDMSAAYTPGENAAENAEVESLSSIELTFNQDVTVKEGTKATCTKAAAELKGMKAAVAANEYPVVANGKVVTIQIEDAITEAGTYTFSIPAESILYANGDYNNAAITVTSTVKAADVEEPTKTVNFTVDPDYSTAVTALPDKITVTYNDIQYVEWGNTRPTVTITSDCGYSHTAASGDLTKTDKKIIIRNIPTSTTAGNYTVSIGAFEDTYDHIGSSDAISFTYTVEGSTYEPKAVTSTPVYASDESHTDLSKNLQSLEGTVKVTFADFTIKNIAKNATFYKLSLKDKDNNEVATPYAILDNGGFNFTINDAITTPGTYTITIPEKVFFNEQGDWLSELTLTATVVYTPVARTIAPTVSMAEEVESISGDYTLTFADTETVTLSNGAVVTCGDKSYALEAVADVANTFKFNVADAITSAGTYEFVIEGYAFTFENGDWSSRFTFSTTIKEKEVVTETADVTVEKYVNEMTQGLYYMVTFNNTDAKVSINTNELSVVKKDADEEAFTVAVTSPEGDPTNQLVIMFGEKNYTDGTYTVSFPANTVKNETTGNYFDAFTVDVVIATEQQGGGDENETKKDFSVNPDYATELESLSGKVIVTITSVDANTEIRVAYDAVATITKEGAEEGTTYTLTQSSDSPTNGFEFNVNPAIEEAGKYTVSIPADYVYYVDEDYNKVTIPVEFTYTITGKENPETPDTPVTPGEEYVTPEFTLGGDYSAEPVDKIMGYYMVTFDKAVNLVVADNMTRYATVNVTDKDGETVTSYSAAVRPTKYELAFNVTSETAITTPGTYTFTIAKGALKDEANNNALFDEISFTMTVKEPEPEMLTNDFYVTADGVTFTGNEGVAEAISGMYFIKSATEDAQLSLKAENAEVYVTKDGDEEFSKTYALTPNYDEDTDTYPNFVVFNIDRGGITDPGTYHFNVPAGTVKNNVSGLYYNEFNFTVTIKGEEPAAETLSTEEFSVSSERWYEDDVVAKIEGKYNVCSNDYDGQLALKGENKVVIVTKEGDETFSKTFVLEDHPDYGKDTDGEDGYDYDKKRYAEDENGEPTSYATNVTFIVEEAITEAGVYHFTIPAGTLQNFLNGKFYDEYSFTYTIKGEEPAAETLSTKDFTVYSETAGDATEVKEISSYYYIESNDYDAQLALMGENKVVTVTREGDETFSMTFALEDHPNDEGDGEGDDEDGYGYDKKRYDSYDEEDEDAEPAYGAYLTFTVEEAITEAGVYHFTIPAGTIQNFANGKFYDEFSFTYTIKDEEVVPPSGDARNLPYENDFTTEEKFNELSLYTGNDHNWSWTNSGSSHGYARLESDYSGGTDKDAWMFTPALNFTDADSEYSVLIEVSASDSTEKVEICLGENATVEAMTTKVMKPTEVTSDDYVQHYGVFKVPEAGVYYVGVHALSAAENDNIIRVRALKVVAGDVYVSTVLGDSDLYVDNREIVVNNAEGAEVSVFTVDGKVVARANGNDSYRFAVNNGIYIVRVGNATAKVVVR